MSDQIRILSVDDHPLVREGIATVINGQPDMQVVAQACSGCEAIQRFGEHKPDVTLMDLRLPDMSGIDAIVAIRSKFPEARFIILATFTGDAEIQYALEAGARAYMLKTMPPQELVGVIRQVHEGKKRYRLKSPRTSLNITVMNGLPGKKWTFFVDLLAEIAIAISPTSSGNTRRDWGV